MVHCQSGRCRKATVFTHDNHMFACMASPLHAVFLWYTLCILLALLCLQDHSLVCVAFRMVHNACMSWNMDLRTWSTQQKSGFLGSCSSVVAPASTRSSRRREEEYCWSQWHRAVRVGSGFPRGESSIFCMDELIKHPFASTTVKHAITKMPSLEDCDCLVYY
jgi:hypothetical protein